jgi:hypothetical protein
MQTAGYVRLLLFTLCGAIIHMIKNCLPPYKTAASFFCLRGGARNPGRLLLKGEYPGFNDACVLVPSTSGTS